ncbi:MAG: carbohydrate kinase family protein [bacterium]
MVALRSLDLISVGDANMDLLMTVPHHPDLESNGDRGSVVRGSRYHLGPGGVAANVAAAAARLGNRVGFVGVVGDDSLGQALRGSLASLGIDLRCLREAANCPTSLVCCFESKDGRQVHYSCPGPRSIPSGCLTAEYLASTELLFLPGNVLTQDEQTGRWLVETVETAGQQDVTVAVDPSKFWMNSELVPLVRRVVAASDILLPNGNEAELLTGFASPLAAARALLTEGPGVVAVKLGEAGCVVCSQEEELEVPAFAVRGQGHLGAGDAFNAGFLHGYLRDWSLERMARFANATASLKLRCLGSQAGLPTAAEVGALLVEHPGEVS